MLSWLIPSIVALGALAWGVYQHFRPRILCKLKYMIDDISKDHYLTFGMASASHEGEVVELTRYADLEGKRIEVRSMGNIAARGILIHIQLRYPIAYWKIETDEHHGEPYGQTGEFNVKVDTLNPTDVLRVLVYFDKEDVKAGENILVEHRVTLNEGKAKQVKHW